MVKITPVYQDIFYTTASLILTGKKPPFYFIKRAWLLMFFGFMTILSSIFVSHYLTKLPVILMGIMFIVASFSMFSNRSFGLNAYIENQQLAEQLRLKYRIARRYSHHLATEEDFCLHIQQAFEQQWLKNPTKSVQQVLDSL